MSFPKDSFDSKTLGLMERAFAAAWEEVVGSGIYQLDGLKTMMTLRIMTAVRDGETDPERLKELALSAVGRVP